MKSAIALLFAICLAGGTEASGQCVNGVCTLQPRMHVHQQQAASRDGCTNCGCQAPAHVTHVQSSVRQRGVFRGRLGLFQRQPLRRLFGRCR